MTEDEQPQPLRDDELEDAIHKATERLHDAANRVAAELGQPPKAFDPNDPLWWLELGSEPAWMQDIRCAQRRIEEERRRLREGGPHSA